MTLSQPSMSPTFKIWNLKIARACGTRCLSFPVVKACPVRQTRWDKHQASLRSQISFQNKNRILPTLNQYASEEAAFGQRTQRKNFQTNVNKIQETQPGVAGQNQCIQRFPWRVNNNVANFQMKSEQKGGFFTCPLEFTWRMKMIVCWMSSQNVKKILTKSFPDIFFSSRSTNAEINGVFLTPSWAPASGLSWKTRLQWVTWDQWRSSQFWEPQQQACARRNHLFSKPLVRDQKISLLNLSVSSVAQLNKLTCNILILNEITPKNESVLQGSKDQLEQLDCPRSLRRCYNRQHQSLLQP